MGVILSVILVLVGAGVGWFVGGAYRAYMNTDYDLWDDEDD